jgi:hypothetical protein
LNYAAAVVVEKGWVVEYFDKNLHHHHVDNSMNNYSQLNYFVLTMVYDHLVDD